MQFFSGFCLANEGEIFERFFPNTDDFLAGFSYGSIAAFELAKQVLPAYLLLFSPAFFQDKTLEFKNSQLDLFNKNTTIYTQKFLKNAQVPSRFFKNSSSLDLEKLLFYTWNRQDLQNLRQKGVKITAIFGKNDKIINAKNAAEFFAPFARLIFLQDKGHSLC